MGSPIRDVRTYAWAHATLQLIRRERSDLHRHGALQLTLGLEAPVRMGSGAERGDGDVSSRVILVATNQDHWFESEGWAAVLWVEPESRVGRRFAHAYLSERPMAVLPDAPMADVWPRLLEMTRGPVPVSKALEVRRAIESAWFDDASRTPPLHPALRKALRYVRGLERTRASADEVARVAGVSRSHLLHLFGDELGIPFRRYLLWVRLRRATECIADGLSATEAAHAAGFHDAAHLARTFRAVAAITPTDLMQMCAQGHFVVAVDPFE